MFSVTRESSTYPLSPVASIRFFHFGCSQINNAASAVSVHQHMVLLKISRSLKRGRKVSMARRIDTSEASGYVSVGCLACERGIDIRFEELAP